jgi:5-histidylcysteine sulfoxide synthase/putative 4-mercaptohistidine N1-methyltranferase
MSVTEEALGSSPSRLSGEKLDYPVNSLPLLNLGKGRAAMLAYFENTWGLTEQLFSSLASDEAFYIRPYHKTRHPLIFYYAHPVCFYVNKLLVSGLIDKPVNLDFELLFETGVDEMNWDDLHEGADDVWPELSAVREYRQQVYELVKDIIQNHADLDGPISQSSPGWALAMGFEHERIHLETSSVLIRELPLEHVKEPEAWPEWLSAPESQNYSPVASKDFPQNELVEVAGGEVKLGKPADWPSFGWDNEYGHDERAYGPFKASKFLISNGEFFEFVKSGGYEQRKYWSESGWGWRQFRNVKWPTFWVQDGPAGSHRYKLRTTFSEIPMQWSWPAVVNYYEAKAYCAWLTEQDSTKQPYRLLGEAEHLAIRDPGQRRASQWSFDDMELLQLDPVMKERGTSTANHNLRYGAESAVNALSANELGFYDSFGNVWQWCEDPFHPLPDFKIHPYYTDFSTPCFDGEHQMILGGSFISTGDEASIWSRFHFRPHFFQHAGFRVVQDCSVAAKKGDKYDNDGTVNQYLLFHFGEQAQQRDDELSKSMDFPQVANLITRTVVLTNAYAASKSRVLDLGCAVGRASFELARSFERVVGLDYSDAFIRAAETLQEQGELVYRRWETGRHFTDLNASIDKDIDRSRIDFVQGDASSLSAVPLLQGSKAFDAILLSNLLCRLSNPEQCLQQFVQSHKFLKPGGILVIASPNTWMEEYTPQEKFLDGANNEGTLAAIGKQLPGFELLHDEDLPFMIREHRRKYEYIISQVSVWKKPE